MTVCVPLKFDTIRKFANKWPQHRATYKRDEKIVESC